MFGSIALIILSSIVFTITLILAFQANMTHEEEGPTPLQATAREPMRKRSVKLKPKLLTLSPKSAIVGPLLSKGVHPSQNRSSGSH